MSTNQGERPDEEHFYPKSELPIFEEIWGKGFVSPGGPNEVAKILKDVDLENKRILDIGCGMGGIDILLVEKYGAAEVIGIDVEKPVLEKAERYVQDAGLTEKISFVLVDPGPLLFEDASFDVVFTKDALLHISDKQMLFSEIFRILKPGGLFVGGDWLRGEYDKPSEQMKLFFELTYNEFDMVTLRDYEKKLTDAGLSEIALLNRNEWYLDVAKAELEKILSLKDEIVASVGIETYENAWESFWKVLVETLKTGEFCPAHIRAKKRL
jgi:ubiquinone/menaquinone biosynthesis C-methylase UbiE